MSRRRGVSAAALALALLPLAAAGRQEAPPAGERFAEETSVVVVEVPVQVVQDGKPVRGLKAENFEVWDGKVRRPITGFEAIDLAAIPAAGRPAPVPPAARRNFLLLFDLAFTSHNSLQKAEAAARDLLARGLHPQDLVGVAFYSPARGVVLPVGFTTDRRPVERVLDALAVLLRRDAAAAERQRRQAGEAGERDPLGLTAPDFRAVVQGIGSLAGIEISLAGEAMEWIVDSDGMLLETLAEMHAITTPFVTAARRGKLEAMTDNLAVLAKLTRDLEGRKYLVYFSDGFDDALMLGSEAAGGGRGLLGNARTLGDLNRMLEELRRAGWIVHTVEAFGVSGNWDETGIGSEGLFYLAKETGGTFFNQTNDLGEAMGRMLEASSVAYVLSFQADEVPQDGSFRKLRVELNGAPRGARVVHRAGWHAPLPPAERPAPERRFAAAELVVAGEEHAEIPVAVLATPFRGEGDRGYVPVIVEIDGAALAAERTAEGLALELYGYAFDAEGRVQDFFAQQLRLDPERARAAGAGALRFVADLALPPGEHELRLLVRGAASGRTTLDRVPLAVPSPQTIAKRLLPPFFVAAEEGTLTLREAGEGDEAYPFRLGAQPFVPAPRPRLGPGEETRLFLAAYHLVDGDLRVSGRVLAADGRPVPGGELTGVGRLRGDQDLARVLATFRPTGLPPGEYRLEVKLVEPKGASVRATAPFEVVAAPAG